MSRKIQWPPKAEARKVEHGRQANRDGEPSWIPVRRWPHDNTLHGELSNSCCDCGLTHLITFEVVRERRGQWWIVKRTYRTGKLGEPLR